MQKQSNSFGGNGRRDLPGLGEAEVAHAGRDVHLRELGPPAEDLAGEDDELLVPVQSRERLEVEGAARADRPEVRDVLSAVRGREDERRPDLLRADLYAVHLRDLLHWSGQVRFRAATMSHSR